MNGKTLQIREERKLMNRILAASKSQSQIDLPKIFRTNEFSFVPLSIFASDGSLHYAKDKSVIVTQLRESQPDYTAIEKGEETNSRKVLIIDAMTIVNKIDIKTESIENCADFASNFSQRINWQASKFEEVRVIFDRYDVKYLKGNTRFCQSKGFIPVHFKVIDTEIICHL